MQRIEIILAGLMRLMLALAVASPMVAMGDATWTGAAFAQGVIKNIEVVGNRRVEPETVRSYLQFSTGEAYNAGKVDASIKALFATGLFADVAIDNKGSTVVVTVKENPVINQVAFEGNSEVDTATLIGEVQLKPRSVFTRAKVQADVQRILDVYRRQGLFAASVEPKVIQLEQDRVNLVFEITEGKTTKVKGINFVGNHAFSDSQLRDVISTTQQGWFDFLKGTSVYDPDRMNLDRELVRQYYLKNGYADVSVTAANAEIDPDQSGFLITFAVDEGQLYNFGAVQMESSLPDVLPQDYQSEILTHAGEVYDASEIDKTTEALTLAIAEKGYAFARVRPRPIPDAAAHTIGITYIVDEGPRIYIERINVIGNDRTKDYVIRREFRLAEGDAFNGMLVDRAKKRLQGLGIFKNVEVKRRPGSAPDRVILDVEITEQSTGELSFGAGYSTSEGVIGDVSITERNLFGNGQYLRLGLSGSFERLQVDLSFTEPRFLDRNLAAGFDLFYKQLDFQQEAGFDQNKIGGQVRLAFPLAENLWMQTHYAISRDDIFNVANNASAAIKEACGASGSGLISGHMRRTARTPRSGHRSSARRSVTTSETMPKIRRVDSICSWMTTLPASAVTRSTGASMPRLAATIRSPRRSRWLVASSAVASRVGAARMSACSTAFFKGGETIRGFDRAGFGPRDLSSGSNQRCAGWPDLLGRYGRGSLPAALRAGRSWPQRRVFRRCGFAV